VFKIKARGPRAGRVSTFLVAGLMPASALAVACHTADDLFPANGTLRLSVVDSALVSQGSTTAGIQIMKWTIDTAVVDIPDTGTFDFLASSPCEQTQFTPGAAIRTLQCGVVGYALPVGTTLPATVHLAISAMEVRRAELPDPDPLDPTLDSDGDGILNADDNCVLIENMDQVDTNDDGFGDACSIDDGSGVRSIPDRDGDGVPDYADFCLWIADAGNMDSDGDGIGDACEQVATVMLGSSPLDLQFSSDIMIKNAGITYVSVNFNDNLTLRNADMSLNCDAAFTTCTLDPMQIMLEVF
jgi:hypothetical protein